MRRRRVSVKQPDAKGAKGQKGPVIFRGKKKLEYDGKTGKFTNCDEANALISRKYREGWVLDG